MADEIKTDQEKSDTDKVKEARESLKAQNDALEAELLRQQKLRAEASLSSTAGIRPVVVPPREETPKEYAERVMQNKVKLKNDGI